MAHEPWNRPETIVAPRVIGALRLGGRFALTDFGFESGLLLQNPLRNAAASKVIEPFFQSFKFAVAVLVEVEKRFGIVCVLR